MRHSPRIIICLLVLAILVGCVLPGNPGNPGSQNELPPTITPVSIPSNEEPPTEAAPDVEHPPTITPEAANENNATTGMVRVNLTAPAAAADQPFTITMLVNNRTRQPITGARAVLTLPKGLAPVEIGDGGSMEGQDVIWNLPDLPANNGRAEVNIIARFRPSFNNVFIESFRVEAPNLDPGLVELSGARYVFLGEVVPIQVVQGIDEISPYEGETVSVEGSVIGVFHELEGFFIFAQHSFLPGASRGLFVYAAGMTDMVNVGQGVRVRGEVKEIEGLTSLVPSSPEDVLVISETAFMPGPYSLDPPKDTEESLRYYESMEGMPVAVGGGVAVSPINRYGEFTIVYHKHEVARLFQGEENGYAITIDDGSNREHADASTLPASVRTGDSFTGTFGIVNYSFGRFKIEPVKPWEVKTTEIILPSVAPAADGEISVMTWNVENLFDNNPPNPSDPPMPSPEDYALDLGKVAATITAAGAPDVVALQEVENIEVLQAIAAVNELTPYAYQPVLEEGTDQRGIDVGYLVRSDRVEVVEVRQYAENQGVYTRPPLLLRVRPKAGGADVYLINNHFTSMSGGVEESEPRRVLQAQGNLSIVEELREADPNAAVAVLGDLNAFYQSAPIDVLRNGGLTHALEKVAPEGRYTYIHEGESQVLDHVLATDALWQRITRVEILHINSDFPPPLPGDPSPTGKSDHDPVVVIFDSK